jgi:cardiolipin synthase
VRAAVVLATALSTVGATLLALNLLIGNMPIDSRPTTTFPVGSAEFRRIMGTVLEPALLDGNRVQPLVNGDEIFPAMLEAVRGARQSITLETYIYWSGEIGQAFAAALQERASRGVAVAVVVDWYGSEMDAALLDGMRRSGIDIRRYNPPRWMNLAQMNHRSHRRLLVVDGTVGFIGGVGLGDKWSGDAQGPDHWRDMHFRVEGPVVAQIQSAFLDHWLTTTGELLHGEAFLPDLDAKGNARAHVFKASPGGGSKSMQLMVLLSIAAARTSIDLSAAYFLPDDIAVGAFVAAMKRGVRVRIVVPGPHMDRPIVARSSRAKWKTLLDAGAELYLYQPTMYHCKVMVVDGAWSSVGSTNFDSRSFTINDEANLNVDDTDLAAALTASFETDIGRSRRFTADDWAQLAWWTKAIDRAATVLDPQL